jgi:acyl transferase domain-containing protein
VPLDLCDAEKVQVYLDRLTEGSGRTMIACVNSRECVSMSGDANAIQEIEDMCKQDSVVARRLKFQQAYHSHHPNPFAEIYRERLRNQMARFSLTWPLPRLYLAFVCKLHI